MPAGLDERSGSRDHPGSFARYRTRNLLLFCGSRYKSFARETRYISKSSLDWTLKNPNNLDGLLPHLALAFLVL